MKAGKEKKHLARFMSAVQSGTLSQSAILVGTVLAAHANPKTGETYPGQDTIARLAHMSKRSVISGLRELRDRRIIDIIKGRRHNSYTMLGDGDAGSVDRVLQSTAPVLLSTPNKVLQSTGIHTGEFTHVNSVPCGTVFPQAAEDGAPY